MLVTPDPTEDDDVGNGVVLTNDLTLGQSTVRYTEKAVALVGVALGSVGDFFRCIVEKVIGLPCHLPVN